MEELRRRYSRASKQNKDAVFFDALVALEPIADRWACVGGGHRQRRRRAVPTATALPTNSVGDTVRSGHRDRPAAQESAGTSLDESNVDALEKLGVSRVDLYVRDADDGVVVATEGDALPPASQRHFVTRDVATRRPSAMMQSGNGRLSLLTTRTLGTSMGAGSMIRAGTAPSPNSTSGRGPSSSRAPRGSNSVDGGSVLCQGSFRATHKGISRSRSPCVPMKAPVALDTLGVLRGECNAESVRQTTRWSHHHAGRSSCWSCCARSGVQRLTHANMQDRGHPRLCWIGSVCRGSNVPRRQERLRSV